MTTTPEQPKAGILRFFSNHPLLGFIGCLGSLASIIGLPFTIWPLTPQRKLTYSLNPVRVPIVQTRQLSDISVNYRGQTITGDVTVAHVAIWNAGREPIRAEDILKPATLTLSNGCQILDAILLKSPREVTGFALDRSQFNSGRIAISWKILEHNDAALIQIVYAGKADARLSFDGVIVGQATPAEISRPASSKTVRVVKSVSLVLYIIFGTFAGAAIFIISHFRSQPMKLSRTVGVCLITFAALIIAVCALQLVLSVVISRSSMPFGVWLA